MSLFEPPMSAMRGFNRTTLWELGRVPFTVQQFIAFCSTQKPPDGGGNPQAFLASEVSAVLSLASTSIFAVDFDNPPVDWFNANQNHINPPFATYFPPPPLLQTVYGDNNPTFTGSVNTFQWRPNNNNSVFDPPGVADFNPYMFTQNEDNPGNPGPIVGVLSLAEAVSAPDNQNHQFTNLFVTLTRTRLLGVGSVGSSVRQVRIDGSFSITSCGVFGGNVFDPNTALTDLADPLPITFQVAQEKRIWAPIPGAIPCQDCTLVF